MAGPPSASARSFVIDPGHYQLGDGGFPPGVDGPVRPSYSTTFHLVHPTRIRVALGEVRPVDSPVSGFRLVGGFMTFGAGFFDMGNFGAVIKVARLAEGRPGSLLFRAPMTFPSKGGPVTSAWTGELPAGDYLLTIRANFHEVLADYDDFTLQGVSVEAENPEATVAPLGPSQLHTAPFQMAASPAGNRGFHGNLGPHGFAGPQATPAASGNPEIAEIYRQRTEQAMVMDLVEAKTQILALELENQKLRDALERTGAGFAPRAD